MPFFFLPLDFFFFFSDLRVEAGGGVGGEAGFYPEWVFSWRHRDRYLLDQHFGRCRSLVLLVFGYWFDGGLNIVCSVEISSRSCRRFSLSSVGLSSQT